MPGKLTTHILDTAHGSPAAGVKIQLVREGKELTSTVTNADGRCDSPLLECDTMFSGPAELHFHIGDYFRRRHVPTPFLDIVPVHFHMVADEAYHVPLVCSPWSYSTYRGS